jgi:formylglycine-generating enzyme required for sulfatase activity
MMNPQATENLPATLALDLGGDVTMDFIRIEDGEFIMGSRGYNAWEEPPHKISISGPFYVATTPVTQQQMAQWTGSDDYKESWFPHYKAILTDTHVNGFSNRPDCPAERVTWYEAMGFCHWINRRMSHLEIFPPGYEASLPTEAQWEFFCRAGTQSEYCCGDGEAALKKVGHFSRTLDSGTEKVGILQPNSWGLYDLHGNVREWCLDIFYQDTYRRPEVHGTDPVAWNQELYHNTNHLRVLRGGSWDFNAHGCRSSSRDWYNPDVRGRYWNIGFRVCLVPGPSVGRSDGKTC